jgi:hypothetical protein
VPVMRSTVLIVAVILLTAVSTGAGFIVSPGGYLSHLAGPPLLGASSGIAGHVSIGPVYPVCRVVASTAPPPVYYNQVQLVVTPSTGLPLTVPLNWVLVNDCYVTAAFKVGLNPGVYSITITSCISQTNSFGCQGVPVAAIVSSNAWTPVEISVNTGIE